MHQSEQDHRNYQHLTLDNGLRLLLVEDNTAKKAAISVCIASGHFNDPPEIHGLVHLLEHMLFAGSEHEQNDLPIDQWLSNNGGSINAWTGTEYTNVHLDVLPKYLTQTIPMLVDMLANPRFELSAIEREIQAIDAEFALKSNDDLRRLYQVHKETCNPEHPFSRFSVGNAKTFGRHTIADLQSELRQSHQQNFNAHNMTACVLTPNVTDALKAQITSTFGAIPQGRINSKPSFPPLYLPEQLGVLINIKPKSHARRLIVSFALPDIQPMYQSKPLEFISHVLGDEGESSLLCYLKNKRWVSNLNVGGGINGSNFKDFNLNFQLTEQGQDQVTAILQAVFHTLNLLKATPVEPWRRKERALIAQLEFDYAESSKPIDEATQFANAMFHYPVIDLLSGDFLVTDFNNDDLSICLDFMTPQNMRVKFIHPDIDTQMRAQWYDTEYKIAPLPPSMMESLSSVPYIQAIKLPAPNEYIINPDTIENVVPELLAPALLDTDLGHKLWFAQDEVFAHPKGDIYVSFDCNAVVEGVAISAHKRLWVAMLSAKLSDEFYRAGVAGLHYHLYAHQAGFTLHTSGFTEKQLELSLDIIQHFNMEFTTQSQFENIKQRQVESLQNALLNRPINRLFTRLSGIVQRYSYAPTELLPVIEQATLQDVTAIRDTLFDRYHMESFVFGNWPLTKVQAFFQQLRTTTPSRKGHPIKRDVVDLKNIKQYTNTVISQHEDAALVMYIQTPTANVRDIALTILIEQLLASPFFHSLRNEKQLGYLVGSGYLPMNQHPGMAFYVQSPHASPDIILNEISDFLSDTVVNIEDFEPVWHLVRKNVVKQLNAVDTNFATKSQRLWISIGNGDPNFNHQLTLTHTLNALTFSDIKDFMTNLMDPSKFGRIILMCPGQFVNNTAIDGENIEDLQQFKNSANFII